MSRRYRQKPTFAEAIRNEEIKYVQLYYDDSLYPEKLTLLKSNEFKISIRRAARQLSPLLSLNQFHFFTILGQKLQIRTSLESCLASFPRRCYGRFVDSRSKQKKDLNSIKDESFRLYSFLMKIVLVIFYRISAARHQEDRELAYSEFLLDIPKLLDIAAIYGQSNPDIVKALIKNAYDINPLYHNDTMDFFKDVYQGKLQQMERNQSTYIDFSPKSLSNQHFGNMQKYMIEKTMLTIFTVKDILFNLTNFIRYFPKNYVQEFVGDYKLQERLVDGVTFFMNQVDNQWNLGDYKERYFVMHLEDLRQSIAIYFIQLFKNLKVIIETSSDQEIIQLAHNTYETFCQMLKFSKKKYHKEYKKLINILIQQSEDIIFFLDGSKIINAIIQTVAAVDFCQDYEKKYRKQYKLSRSIDFDPILNINRNNLKQFKQSYIDPKTQKRNQIAKENDLKLKKNLDYAFNAYISNLKYSCKDKEYDDQPEQDEFGHVELPHQYVKSEQKLVNLSFSMAPRKRYVPKDSVSQDKNNFQFSYAKKQEELGSLSFFQQNEISIIQVSDMSMIVQQQPSLGNLQISRIDENIEQFGNNEFSEDKQFQRFCWDNEIQNIQKSEMEEFIQKVNAKENTPLENLSFT